MGKVTAFMPNRNASNATVYAGSSHRKYAYYVNKYLIKRTRDPRRDFFMFASPLAKIVTSCNYSIIMDLGGPHNIEPHTCGNFSSKMGLIFSKIDYGLSLRILLRFNCSLWSPWPGKYVHIIACTILYCGGIAVVLFLCNIRYKIVTWELGSRTQHTTETNAVLKWFAVYLNSIT